MHQNVDVVDFSNPLFILTLIDYCEKCILYFIILPSFYNFVNKY